MEHREEIIEIIDYYAGQKNPREQENLVAMLREIQETEGCIPTEARDLAAEKIGIKPSVLSCIIRLYPSLKEAKYLHEILVCTGERCGNKNSRELLEFVRKELRTDKNGISADQKCRLVTRNCLKQCRTSPNIQIDGKLYPAMSVKELRKLLEDLR